MADEIEDAGFRERPELHCQLFVPCHTVWYDADRPEQGYSLGRVLLDMLPGGSGYPIEFGRLFGYMQVYGEAGDYSVRFRLVRVALGDDGEHEEEPLGEDESHVEYGPWAVEVLSADFVNEYAFPMRNVLIRKPGLYEFQLLRDAEEVPLFRVRVIARAQDGR